MIRQSMTPGGGTGNGLGLVAQDSPPALLSADDRLPRLVGRLRNSFDEIGNSLRRILSPSALNVVDSFLGTNPSAGVSGNRFVENFGGHRFDINMSLSRLESLRRQTFPPRSQLFPRQFHGETRGKHAQRPGYGQSSGIRAKAWTWTGSACGRAPRPMPARIFPPSAPPAGDVWKPCPRPCFSAMTTSGASTRATAAWSFSRPTIRRCRFLPAESMPNTTIPATRALSPCRENAGPCFPWRVNNGTACVTRASSTASSTGRQPETAPDFLLFSEGRFPPDNSL